MQTHRYGEEERVLIVRNALDGIELLRIRENDLEWPQNSEYGEEGRVLYSDDSSPTNDIFRSFA